MPTNRRIFSQDAAAAAAADSAEGLVLHLDANDEDSIESGGANTGSGSGTWFDIANHDLNVPLIDKGSNLVLHLNASDTNSYGGSGNTWTDLSTYGNDGAISNTGGTNNPTFESDTRGYFDFEASDGNDNVEVTDSSSLDITTNITLEAWINEESVFNYGRLFWKNGAYALYRGTNGWNFLTGSDVLVHNSDIPSTGTWYHIAATYDGANKKLYINGTLVFSEGETASIPTNNNSLFIGGDGTAGRYFDGKVSSVRVYDVALTASEVAQNYRANSFFSYSSIYSTDLDMNLDAANYTSGTWDDTVTSNSATVTDALFDKELGNFFTFDGATSAGDRIEFPHDATLNQGADISWEVWVKRDDTGLGTILHKGTSSSGTSQYFFYYSSTYGYLWYSYAQGGGIYSGNAATTVGVWEHVVFTNDSSGNGKMYVNGELTASSTLGSRSAPTASVTNSNVLNIGGYDAVGANNGHDGEIGVVRFYDTALTAAQVAQNYLATKNDYPNGINGDIQGATFQGSSTPYHFDFNGSTNYVDVPYTTLGDRDFTLTVYVKFDDLSAERYIWSKYLGNPSGQYGMLAQTPLSSDKISWSIFDTGNGTPISITTSTSLTTTPYYHLAFVYVKETSAVIYLNGISDGSASYSTSNPFGQNTAQVRFGRYQSTTVVSLDGEIGQVKIFDKALSASEVLAEYNATKTPYV